MARKPLGKDQFGIQKVMRGSDYFGDAMGQFALNAINGMVGQLTYFYTDKAGLAAGMVATMFLVTKIIDAFTDIITLPAVAVKDVRTRGGIDVAVVHRTAGKFHAADRLYAGNKSVDDIRDLYGGSDSLLLFAGSQNEQF